MVFPLAMRSRGRAPIAAGRKRPFLQRSAKQRHRGELQAKSAEHQSCPPREIRQLPMNHILSDTLPLCSQSLVDSCYR